MSPSEEREVHAMLTRQIEGIGKRMDDGFAEMRSTMKDQCDGIREELMVYRTEFNDRIANHKAAFRDDIVGVHKRVDDHLDDHVSMSTKVKLNGRLPVGEITLTGAAKTCTKIAAIGGVVAGGVYLLKMLNEMIAAGLPK